MTQVPRWPSIGRSFGMLGGHGEFWAGKGRKVKDGSTDVGTKLRALVR